MTDETKPLLATFGLRLGLMCVFLLFGVLPLIKFYLAFRLNAGEADVALGVPFDFWEQAAGLGGFLTLIATFLAWRGRIYWIFQGVLIFTMVAVVAEAAVRIFVECEGCMVDPASENDIVNYAFRTFLPFQSITFIYMLWYINRTPARTFYRKYSKEQP